MIDRSLYRSFMAAIASAAAAYLFLLLAAPVLKPLAWALIIGIATTPHYERLTSRFPGRPGASAGIMLLVITVCFILPVVAILIAIANNAQEWFGQAAALVQEVTRGGIGTIGRIPLLNRLLSIADQAQIDLASHAEAMISNVSGFLLGAAATTAKGVAEVMFIFAVALFILFFIYRDGRRVFSTAMRGIAGDDRHVWRVMSGVQSAVTAVFFGTIYTCIAQGTLAGIGYYVADVPAPILWGALTAVVAIIPVVGTAVIWVPLTAFIALNGDYMTALLLGLWCLIFVGFADNAIRPLAVGAQSDIPVLAVVLGAIGGATAMGILGLLVGPVVFASVVAVWQEMVPGDRDSGVGVTK